MKSKLLTLIVLIISFLSCKKEIVSDIVPIASEELRFTEFGFDEQHNAQTLLKNIKGNIYNDKIIGVMPYISDNKLLVATFKFKGAIAKVGDVEQQSGITINDFSKPVNYKIIATDGTEKIFTVTVQSFTGLPVLYLETEGPVVSKDDYVNGNLIVDPNSQFSQSTKNIKLKVKGRGNSTWTMPKKPYKLKFDKSTELLGMPASKNWVLLANFADKTLMRNYLGFEMAKQFGINYTSEDRFVELFMNGEYLGNYLVTEQIEIGKSRVDIQSLNKNDTTPEKITGGYLLEIDQRLDAPFWFHSKNGVPFTIKEPENINDAQLNYLKDYVQKTEDVIYSDDFNDPSEGYAKYIDVNSFINWYLVNELMKNNDAIFFSSVYMYKDRGGKLSLGPVWDFDIAAGNINYNGNNSPEGWWIRNALWMNRLIDDPLFRSKVKDRWTELKRTSIPSLFSYINEANEYLKYSQRQNFKKWDILYAQTWPNAVVLGTYQNEVQYLKDWLSKRIKWMDDQFLNSY